jgi:hypothetical protein
MTWGRYGPAGSGFCVNRLYACRNGEERQERVSNDLCRGRMGGEEEKVLVGEEYM